MYPGLPCGLGAMLVGPGPQMGERSHVESSSGLSLSTAHAAPNRALSLGSPHPEGTIGEPRPRPGKEDGHSDSWRGGQGKPGLGPAGSQCQRSREWDPGQEAVSGPGGLGGESILLQERLVLDSSWTGSGCGEQAGMALAARALPSWGCGADAPTPLQPWPGPRSLSSPSDRDLT